MVHALLLVCWASLFAWRYALAKRCLRSLRLGTHGEEAEGPGGGPARAEGRQGSGQEPFQEGALAAGEACGGGPLEEREREGLRGRVRNVGFMALRSHLCSSGQPAPSSSRFDLAEAVG